MGSLLATSAKPRGRKVATPARGWWGEGPPPHERWPGVTIKVDDCGGKYRFDAARADLVCQFFPKFGSHSKGAFAGQRFELMDYQTQLILRPLFGWVGREGGTQAGLRRFQKSYVEIPKKNGKTQLLAGLGLFMFLCDSEPGAEVYVAAADREQARVLFSAVKAMIEADSRLSSRCTVYRNSIVSKKDPGAFFQVLSAEAATKHGPNIHCLIIDELHAQPDRDLFEALTRGVVARQQPLIMLITTAGDDDESICYEEYDYAKRVLSGTIEDEHHLPVIFEATDKDDWTQPAVWQRVNPGLGKTIPTEKIESLAREAMNEPRKRNDFLRYHLNRWVNQSTSWIPVEWWDACAGEMNDAHLSTLRCAAGLDMAQKIDLAAFVVVFQEFLDGPAIKVEVTADAEDGQPEKRELSLNYRLHLLPFFWLPEATVRDREREGFTSYQSWADAGLLTVTDGASIDYDRVYRDITQKIVPRFPLLKQGVVGYDPAFATDIAARLRDKAGLVTSEVLQNYKHMTQPCLVFEALVKERRVVHDGNRLLRWNVENVAVKHDDAGRIRPVKPKKAAKKIDGLVAALMGQSSLDKIAAPPVNIYNDATLRPDGFLTVDAY